MSILKIIITIYYGIFVCDGRFADILTKCSIKDSGCLTSLYEKIIKYGAVSGIPEYNLPPLDPFILKNVTVSVLDIMTLTIVEGVVKGIKNDCVLGRFDINLDTEVSTEELTCSLTVEGKVRLTGLNPVMRALIGDNQNTEGKIKLKFAKLHINYKIPFRLIMKDNKVYTKMQKKGLTYTYDLKCASLAAEKIFIANYDVSKIVVSYFNSNWRMLLHLFGGPFIDKAIDIYLSLADEIFTRLPFESFIIEDLSSYVRV